VANFGTSKAVPSRGKGRAGDQQIDLVLARDFGNRCDRLVNVIGEIVVSAVARNHDLR
jgi:hypothetical protein